MAEMVFCLRYPETVRRPLKPPEVDVIMRFSRPLTALALSAAVLLVLGNGALATPPGEKPAPTPFSRLADAGTTDDHPGADHVVVFTEAVNKVKPSGVTYVDGYDLTKILTSAGSRDREC